MVTVSVVIPCFNCERTLSETIVSLQNQVFKDFEVILINDGSTDNTLSVIEEKQRESKLNIRVINQINSGVSAARNQGIKRAKGRFIAFLDSDDTYSPYFLNELLKNSAQDDFEGCYCLLTRHIKKISHNLPEKQLKKTQAEVMDDFLTKMGDIGFYCVLYDKKVLLENGILFDQKTKHFEDREFTWKYLANINNIYCSESRLYLYRINRKSVLHKRTHYYTDSLDAVKRIEAYLVERRNPFSDRIKNELYPRCMWSLVKTLSAYGKYGYIKRLRMETDVDICMKKCAKEQKSYVRLLSSIYCLNTFLFFLVIKMFKWIIA